MNPEEQFETILSILADADVDFILIGGLAAMASGLARATYDVDVVYSRADAKSLRNTRKNSFI